MAIAIIMEYSATVHEQYEQKYLLEIKIIINDPLFHQ